MSRKRKGNDWRGKNPGMGALEWLRGLGVALAIGIIAWASTFLATGTEASAYAPQVVISRVMTSNPSACYSLRGKYYDWLELQNISGEPVNLAGWRLTDAGDLRGAFTFGDITLQPNERLIVYCHKKPDNFTGSEIFSGFKLSSDGETLLLSDPAQHVQSLAVPAMGKRDIYQRDPETGVYNALSFYLALGSDQAYTSTLTPPYNPSGVMISEVMAVNRSTLMDEDGDYSDWVELFNGSRQAVSLKGCALSDDDAVRMKWVFPDVTLKPGGYLVVFCSGKDRTDPNGVLHTNFRLSKGGEAIRLYNPAADAISYVRYDSAVPDVSFSRKSDGTMTARLDPSPGQPNTAEGARAALSAMVSNSLGLVINELSAGGKGADWVEIRNTGDGSLDLSGMGLSDRPAKPRKWQFPEGATISAGGYVLVRLAGGEDESGEPAEPADIKLPTTEDATRYTVVQPDYTADFGLSEGETVCLTTSEGRVLDRVKLYDQFPNISFGRADGYDGFRYFSQETPGQPNAQESFGKVAREVTFSTPPGIVRDAQIQLRMSTTPGVSIYYTTDGTAPTQKSRRYDGAITLNANTCIRAVAMGDDAVPSEPVVASFIFGQHNLRLVSVIGDASKLTGSKGVLRTGTKLRAGTPVIAEMYEPDGTRLIAQPCTLKVVGHHSRIHYDQKSFKLTAKRADGDTRFRARLFSNRDYEEVKSVVLRASGQDVFQTHMRDSILASLAADTPVFYQETEPCVVYVNGKYWGVYNMREHVDQHSIAQFEGWKNPDDVVISEGDDKKTDYHSLLSWVGSHDLSSDSNVETLRTAMDIENYLDYVILQMYTCNQDLNNVRRYKSTSEDPRWKWAIFDLDLSYQLERNNIKEWFDAKVGSITTQEGSPFRYLMRNDTLRDYFLTRFGQLLATTLSSENVVAKIQARHDLLEEEMPQECKRWKWKVSTWEHYVAKMTLYAQNRPQKVVGFLADAFHLSDAQTQHYFGEALQKAAQQS